MGAHQATSPVQHRLPSTSCCRHGYPSWVFEPKVELGPYTTWRWWQTHPSWTQSCLDSRPDHPLLDGTSPEDREAVDHLVQRHLGAAESRLGRGERGDHSMAGGWPGQCYGETGPSRRASGSAPCRFDTLSGTSDQLSYPGSPIRARSSHQLSTIPTASFFSCDHHGRGWWVPCWIRVPSSPGLQ